MFVIIHSFLLDAFFPTAISLVILIDTAFKCFQPAHALESRLRTNFSLKSTIQPLRSTWHTCSQREKKIVKSLLKQQSQASQRRHRRGYPFTCLWQKNVAWDRLSKNCSLLVAAHSIFNSSPTAFLANKRRTKDYIWMRYSHMRIWYDLYVAYADIFVCG